MIFNKKVEEIFKKAKADAETLVKNTKGEICSYGNPLVMMELINEPDFQSAYTGEIKSLRMFVRSMVQRYRGWPVKEDLKGYDIQVVQNMILPDLYKRLNDVVKTPDITLAHLFWALTSSCITLPIDDFMRQNGVNKFEVFYNLLTHADVDSDTVDYNEIEEKIVNYEIDMENEKAKIAIVKEEATAGPANPVDERVKANDKKILEAFCTDLVEAAKSYDKPFIGREDVIRRTMQVLCKAEKSNPVHVGEPGVGKTAVTKGLAKLILEDKVPDVLKGSHLYELDLSGMLAGTKYRGDFEARIKGVLSALQRVEKPILFVDEIHMLIGAGACGQDAMDAANILKPYLTDGSIKFIGATTYKEYSLYIEKDPALSRRFQRIDIVEPSIEDTIKIVNGLKEFYEEYHKLEYKPEAIRMAVELSAKHIHDRFLPDKAIDLIDEAGAYVNITEGHEAVVDESDIEHIICDVCKVSKKAVRSSDYSEVAKIEDTLNAKVFGQKEAVKAVSEAIKLSKSGLGDDTKPIASFLFVGPSGVGKTELAKQIADSMAMKLVRFDMSEYGNELGLSKLIGSSSGYVGYDDGGLLTNAVLKSPNCVLLLDEIEKAHPEIFKIFLQVFDYGMLTDNKGKKVDFRNAIIIMTSNAGVADASKPALGFGNHDKTNTSAVMDAVNNLFPVEFRNRLSGIVTFNGLSEEVSVLIANKELNLLKDKLAAKGVFVEFDESCLHKIAKDGTSYEFGARNLQRYVDQNIKKMFVSEIINGTAPALCRVEVLDDKFVIIPLLEERECEAVETAAAK